MYDKFNRHIHYLRISVTDRCNLRCRYCMPEAGVERLPHAQILSFEEIMEVVRTAVEMGVDKIRLTGGEPLVRRGIVDLVRMITAVEGVKDLGLTTNGILLPKYAKELKKAGLKRVNISLDTLDAVKYHEITRLGKLDEVMEGIRVAQEVGFDPIKINCVVMKSSDEPDAIAVKQFCKEQGLQVRFIHQMDLETGEFSIVEGGEGGDCAHCNRLRLTADGQMKPCLFSDIGFSVRELGVKQAILESLDNKPACGSMNHTGAFYNIGG